jgi:hypothetical protein
MEENRFILKDIDYDEEIAKMNLQKIRILRNSPYENTASEDYCEEYGCFNCSKCKRLINIY